MKKLNSELFAVTGSLPSADKAARIARRAARVQSMFKEAVEHIYKENAPYVLAHVNAVYIKDEPVGAVDEGNTVRTLMVYMDDGNFRSDVYSRQHLIMLLLHERFGEKVEVFKAFPSRFNMRTRHPYASVDSSSGSLAAPCVRVALDGEEQARALRVGELIDDARVRASFLKAMTTSLECEKGEKAAKARKIR